MWLSVYAEVQNGLWIVNVLISKPVLKPFSRGESFGNLAEVFQSRGWFQAMINFSSLESSLSWKEKNWLKNGSMFSLIGSISIFSNLRYGVFIVSTYFEVAWICEKFIFRIMFTWKWSISLPAHLYISFYSIKLDLERKIVYQITIWYYCFHTTVSYYCIILLFHTTVWMRKYPTKLHNWEFNLEIYSLDWHRGKR